MSNETIMLINRLKKFNNEQEKPIVTLFDVYPDEMNEIVILLKEMNSLLKGAGTLVGNPGTNISGSCDVACIEWQERFQKWKTDNVPGV